LKDARVAIFAKVAVMSCGGRSSSNDVTIRVANSLLNLVDASQLFIVELYDAGGVVLIFKEALEEIVQGLAASGWRCESRHL
jgi:hypothetical protein